MENINEAMHKELYGLRARYRTELGLTPLLRLLMRSLRRCVKCLVIASEQVVLSSFHGNIYMMGRS